MVSAPRYRLSGRRIAPGTISPLLPDRITLDSSCLSVCSAYATYEFTPGKRRRERVSELVCARSQRTDCECVLRVRV